MTTTVSASDSPAQLIISENGAPGDAGATGANGTGLNNIRKSMLDNPLLHLFKSNDLSAISSPTNTNTDITWSRTTTATYVDRYGVVKIAAIDTPREEKNGWLLEGESTNTILRSENIDDAAWSKLNATIIANDIDAPDENLTADKVTVTANGQANFRQQVFLPGGSAGNDIAFSIWLKAGNITDVSFRVFATNETNIDIVLTDKWQRFELSLPSITATTPILFIYMGSGGAASTATAGDFIHAWGGQLEDGLLFASSYIPTVATPVTRTTDIVTAQLFNNWPLVGFSSYTLTLDILGYSKSFSPILAGNGLPLTNNSLINNYSAFVRSDLSSTFVTIINHNRLSVIG